MPTLPAPPVIPSGQEIYDALMGGIEPELTSQMLPLLEGKYASETKEQRAARKRRYKAAFTAYRAAYEAYIADLTDQVRRYRRTAMQSVEEQDRIEEETALSALEATMNAA